MAYRELDAGSLHGGVDDALLESSSTGTLNISVQPPPLAVIHPPFFFCLNVPDERR